MMYIAVINVSIPFFIAGFTYEDYIFMKLSLSVSISYTKHFSDYPDRYTAAPGNKIKANCFIIIWSCICLRK